MDERWAYQNASANQTLVFMNKFLLLPAIGVAFSSLNVKATVVFDASTTNVNVVGNAVGLLSNNLYDDPSTGALTLSSVTLSNNNASGLASADDIDTLKGTPLLATDTVTMTLGISDSTLNNIRANGIEFGMSPNGTGFRPASNLIFQIDADNDASGMAIGNIPALTLNVAGWGVTEASLGDGFTATLVANNAGYTFTLSDIQEVGNLTNTTLSYSNTFSGTEFIDNFGGGHLYYTRQIATGEGDVNISEFSIDVTSIPEPSTTALLGLLTLGSVFKRRRIR
ncbi:MAG: PEP-CTERM sorting domain-containing protein [Akkermansiaceae bacterium]